MMKTGIFGKAHLETLKKAVGVYSQRHQVTAQNIANVETAGYRTRKVKFEELLSAAGPSIKGYRTHERHFAIGRGGVEDVQAQVREARTGHDNGVNDVDIDSEMANLATNDLTYRLATRLLSARYSVLRGAIKGQMR
ncbi:MAG: flagellar basal body rod protein FlgB [bacterium]|nr:flagellar basal body rod protein FlgB [bacterium]